MLLSICKESIYNIQAEDPIKVFILISLLRVKVAFYPISCLLAFKYQIRRIRDQRRASWRQEGGRRRNLRLGPRGRPGRCPSMPACLSAAHSRGQE